MNDKIEMDELTKYTVVAERNDYGTMMLRGGYRNETVFIVECSSPDVRDELKNAEMGSTIYLGLERVGQRGNAWRATAAQLTETCLNNS